MENNLFRTQIKIKPEKNRIDYTSKIILFGSCFSENIGKKFSYFKFDELTNPYGILFNPSAIETAITECISQKKYSKEDLFFHNEQWHSYNHHSDFSNTNSTVVLENINQEIRNTYTSLKKASHLILTLGTAWVYKLVEKKQIVANCHKVPLREFEKKILSIEEIKNSLRNIKTQLQFINPEIVIILTVSPVRHLKDGMTENALSKAHLLSAIHQVTDSKTSYFPSNEIVLDDLRDYRFYEKDMVHPNEIAIDYIWNIFKNTWIDNATEKLQKEIDTIQKGLSHKPYNSDSEGHKKFQQKLTDRIDLLKNVHQIDFKEDINISK